MFKIRKSQMEALAAIAGRDFETRLAEHLFTSYQDGAERLGEDAVRARVRRWVARAKAIGMTEEMHVLTYVDVQFRCLLEHGEELDLP